MVLSQVGRQVFGEVECVHCGKIRPKFTPCDCEEAVAIRQAHLAMDAEYERQRQIDQRKAALKASRLPSRYHDARIESADRPPVVVVDYCKHHSGGLYLAGPVGVGKTHMAACIVNSLLDAGESVLFGGVVSLLGMIQATYSGQGDEAAIMRQLSTVRYLVIDDIGKEKVSEWVEQTLYRVIDARYGEELPLIVTSNWTPDQLEKRYPTVGAAIVSRLAEMCLYAEMHGKDRRRG